MIRMDEEYLIMIKEASELQDLIEEKPDTLYCEGHHVYVKYPVHDEITGEDSYAIWSWGKRWFKEPLWKPEEIKIPRQKDLQEIYSIKKEKNNGVREPLDVMLEDFSLFINSPDTEIPYAWSMDKLWLEFIMDYWYGKEWNQEIRKWDD